MKEISKDKLCAGSIYYLCMLLKADVSKLNGDIINKIFDSLCKLDYNQTITLFNDLNSIYEKNI